MQAEASKRLKQAALRKLGVLYQEEIERRYISLDYVVTGELLNSMGVKGSQSDQVLLFNKSPHAAPMEFGSKNYSAPPPFRNIEVWLAARFGLTGKQLKAATKDLQKKIQAQGIKAHPVWARVFSDGSFAESAAQEIISELDK
jgi:hypothetical protein